MIESHGHFDVPMTADKLSANFGVAPLICPCGCGKRSVLLIVDPGNYRGQPVLGVPVEEIEQFVAQLQLVAAQLRGQVQ